jgi:exo-1,4-beta-D-glucosaminidase
VVAKQSLGKSKGNNWMTLTVENHGEGVAFMVHPRVTRGKGGDDVTPIFWSDNYFSLMPGEKRNLRAHYDDAALGGKEPVLEVEGYNVAPGSVPVGAFSATPED